MAIIETGNGKLYWQQGREKMIIEPWGRHSLRVRVSRNSCIDQAENWALLPQAEQAGAVVSRDEAQGSVSIQNGNIRATIRSLYGARVARAVTIQYGGSMNAKNAHELLAQPDVDGGLIGGASLKAPDFAVIVNAATKG